MSGISVYVEHLAGQTRAAALDKDGRPIRVFFSSVTDTHARWGDVLTARIRSIATDQGGAFAELETGEEAFLSRRPLGKLTEGAAFTARIEAEAREGKLCRATPTTDAPPNDTPLERWLRDIPGGAHDIKETNAPDERIAAAFEETVSSVSALPGGGKLRLARTPALTAIDVDTAGRPGKGSAAARALAVNTEAATEAARQTALRELGGLVVLDCVAPTLRDHGKPLKGAFLGAFRAFSTRKAEALPPSPFGLMEAALAWRWRPIEEAASPLFDALRDLESAASSDRTARFTLRLPTSFGYTVLDKAHGLTDGLHAKYGARLSILDADAAAPHLSRDE